MADVTDVSGAIASFVAGRIYPNGTGSPSIAETDVLVYEGWPVAQQLDKDIRLGKAHVSVYTLPGETITTRYLNDGESIISISTPKMVAAVSGQDITLSGVIPAADDLHVLHMIVNGQEYHYAVQPTDTLDLVASGLAAAVAVDVPGAASTSAVISVPAPARVKACRVAVVGQYATDLRRQRRLFQVTVWAPSPDVRKALAAPIDVALSKVRFLALPDQLARILYQSSPMTDGSQKDGIYRRDLIYSVDYGTTDVQTSTTVGVLSIAGECPTVNL